MLRSYNKIFLSKKLQLNVLLMIFLFSISKSWGKIYLHNFRTTSTIIELKKILQNIVIFFFYDLSGKLLITQSLNQLQTKINIENISSGIYFMKIESPYKIENFKIIISK